MRKKIARDENPELKLICNNSDFVVEFDLDAEWNQYGAKTARFIYNNKYVDVVFVGTTVSVPPLCNTRVLAVGLYAEDLRTTTPALVEVEKSILCEDGVADDPSPDVYNQIMDLMNECGVGVPGATFTPSVSEDGTLSWTNDRDLENPSPVNIRGKQGEKGDTGKRGEPGAVPYIGDNLTWWIDGKDTGVTAAGQHGKTPYIYKGFWYIDNVDTGVRAQGTDGYSPYIGSDGNWVIMGNYNSGVPATGPQGPEGKTGPQGNPGDDGKDGLTPHIGANGNWWIGDYDTGKPSRGEQGIQGIQGEPGQSAEAPWQVIADYSMPDKSAQYWEVNLTGKYTEIYIEGVYKIETEETSSKSIQIRVGRSGNYIVGNAVSVKAGDTVYHRAYGKITPSKKMVYFAIAATSRFADVSSNCNDPTTGNFEYFDSQGTVRVSSNSSAHLLGAGSTIKIWGR